MRHSKRIWLLAISLSALGGAAVWAAGTVGADKPAPTRVVTDLKPETVLSIDSHEDAYISHARRSPQLVALVFSYSRRNYELMTIDMSTHETRAVDFTLSSDVYVDPDIWMDTDSRGRTWFATVDRLAVYDPASRVATEVAVPLVSKPFKPEYPNEVEFEWERQRLTGMIVDDYDRVWVSRDNVLALLKRDPKTGRWAEVDGPVSDEVVGPVRDGGGPFIFASTAKFANPRKGAGDLSTRMYNSKSGKWTAWPSLGFPIGSLAPGKVEFRRMKDGALQSLDTSSSKVSPSMRKSPVSDLGFMRIRRNGDLWQQPDETKLVREGRDGNKVWVFPKEIAATSGGDLPVVPLFRSTAFDDKDNLWAVVERAEDRQLVKFER